METLDLTMLAGLILSVLFEYVPGLEGWYAKLPTPQHKRLVMLGLVVLAALGTYGASCGTPLVKSISCNESGMWELIRGVIMAIVVNQSIHPLTKKG